jgi:glyoxylase-like metal-dependent hydrolase (beta-lactamase superfamily II)
VLIHRSVDSRFLSNAYLVADEPGGTAVFVDSGAPLEPLLEIVERERLTVTHLLTTHGHTDHVEHDDELHRLFRPTVLAHPWTGHASAGGLEMEALPTPGHSLDGLAFILDGVVFTGDTLFKDSIGGGDFEQLRHSVMRILMELPLETRVFGGHGDETTIGREWEENPFVRVWRGVQPEGSDAVRVGGADATLIVWSPDYDGKGKAWVRVDGLDRIVGGSAVERQ